MLTAEQFVRSGKVRDLYELPDERLLLVASDRISAFDVVLPTEIPDKGRVLTGLSRFWFGETAGIVPNHLLDTDPAIVVNAFRAAFDDRPDVPVDLLAATGSFDDWRGRVMVCRPAEVVPVEAVVRGYVSGSGWKEYAASGTICGIPLPAGLRESDALPKPIFTPAEKAPAGEHDRNITFDEMVEHIARSSPFEGLDAGALAERIRDVSLRLYGYGAAVAQRAGIILADTKFELGIPVDGELAIERLTLVDEVMTSDSSRFWDAATYRPGGPQPSYDKQFVRDWLERQPWDKTAPGPALPRDVVDGTRARYVEAYERITGASFERYLSEDVIAP
jgi:phosphoribosylaminoimidazole-succinocarboxamide synthase